MKNEWNIPVTQERQNRVAITYGDPADALNPAAYYALKPLPDAILNWETIVSLLRLNQWHDVTAFYSRRKLNVSKRVAEQLSSFNQNAFDAAKTKGGLILYFQGVILADSNQTLSPHLSLPFRPNCLSFCIWNTVQEAKEGANIPEHKRAAQMTALWYEGFSILKYRVKRIHNKQQQTIQFQQIPYN